MVPVVNPALALLIGLIVLLLAGIFIWPQKGLISIWNRFKTINTRVLVEDALKFLFDCEYKNIFCNLNSVAGHLNISHDRATRLIGRLKTMGLISMHENTFLLTDAGRSYALRIIRVHRIWEKYLADETGIKQIDWHPNADQMEHQMSMEAADQLARQIGNPVFDPHGDPIPSSAGDIPEHTGHSLNMLNEGDIARIIHIEDEPQSIYEQIVALGLYPGMEIYVTDINEGKIQFAANGDECTLTSLFAASVTVEKIIQELASQENYERLSDLKLGESAEVTALSPNCRGQQRRRLMDLGIIPGTVIAAVLKSASGDPVAYDILGASIAIRKKQADLIFVKRKNTGS